MRLLLIGAALVAASFSVTLGLPIVWQAVSYALVGVMVMLLPAAREGGRRR